MHGALCRGWVLVLPPKILWTYKPHLSDDHPTVSDSPAAARTWIARTAVRAALKVGGARKQVPKLLRRKVSTFNASREKRRWAYARAPRGDTLGRGWIHAYCEPGSSM